MAKKVLIVDNRRVDDHKVIETEATTFAELRRDVAAAGVTTLDTAWYEGISRTELKDDNQMLPQIPESLKVKSEYDLVLLLSVAKEKTKSGISRSELYEDIRNLGLQEQCKKEFGKNFTQCSSAQLLSLIKGVAPQVAEEAKEEIPEEAKEEKPFKEANNSLYLLTMVFDKYSIELVETLTASGICAKYIDNVKLCKVRPGKLVFVTTFNAGNIIIEEAQKVTTCTTSMYPYTKEALKEELSTGNKLEDTLLTIAEHLSMKSVDKYELYLEIDEFFAKTIEEKKGDKILSEAEIDRLFSWVK